jgi:hypothetical protein
MLSNATVAFIPGYFHIIHNNVITTVPFVIFSQMSLHRFQRGARDDTRCVKTRVQLLSGMDQL